MLKTFIIKPEYIIYQIQRNMTPWYLFDFITRKAGNIHIAFKYLLLKITSKKFDKEEVLFDYFSRF